MKRGGSAVRPVGTDGSDFSFRMTVDGKYRRAAHARMHLRRFVAIQTAFVLFKALWTVLMTLRGEPLDMATVCASVFGGASVLVGTLGKSKTQTPPSPEQTSLLSFSLSSQDRCFAASPQALPAPHRNFHRPVAGADHQRQLLRRVVKRMEEQQQRQQEQLHPRQSRSRPGSNWDLGATPLRHQSALVVQQHRSEKIAQKKIEKKGEKSFFVDMI